MFLEGEEEGNAEQSSPDFEKQYSQTQFDSIQFSIYACFLKKKERKKHNANIIFSVF